MLSEGVAEDLVPTESENEPTFFHSLSISAPDILESQSGGPAQNLLEPGVDDDDALYNSNVNDVACTDGTFVTKGLVMRGRNGRRGDRAIGP